MVLFDTFGQYEQLETIGSIHLQEPIVQARATLLMEKFHFGSLEHQIKFENENFEQEHGYENEISGLTIEELEADNSPQKIEITPLQAEFLVEKDIRQRERKVKLPTDDKIVRIWLRTIREPITLFGEGPYDRRERLRKLLASERASDYRDLLSSVGLFELLESRGKTDKVDDTEEFFVPGSSELVEWRKWISKYSLPKSQLRLKEEKRLKELSPSDVMEKRQSLYNDMSNFNLFASQVGGERPISACSFSGDSALIATGDFAGICRLWSSEDCSLIRDLEGVHTSRIGSIIFSPDTKSELISSCDSEGKIALWNLQAKDAVSILTGHTNRVSRIAFHPSGKLLGSASFDFSWRLWDIERGMELQLQEGHSKGVYSIGFHPDGSLCATGGLDAHGRIWDLRIGRAIWTLQGHVKSILSISFNPKLPTLATAGEDCTVRIWDLRKLQPSYILPAHSSVISTVKWDESGDLLVTSGFDGLVKVWGSGDWRNLGSLAGHDGKVLDVDWNCNRITSVGMDRTFKIWSSDSMALSNTI